MIHPDVIEKYLPASSVLGMVGAAGASPAAPAASGGADAPLLKKKVREPKTHEGEGQLGGYSGACLYCLVSVLREIFATIFRQKNITFTNDRLGLTRSAVFLIVFIIIHAVGNLHVFLGPDDFNGYGYFYVRLYFTGFGLPANIVEIYVLLCAVLHVAVATKRTWDISLNYTPSSGKLHLAFSGVLLLTYMTIHLFQFRFGDTEPYMVRPPPYFINFSGILQLQLFWSSDTSVQPVPVRDIQAGVRALQEWVLVPLLHLLSGCFLHPHVLGMGKGCSCSIYGHPEEIPQPRHQHWLRACCLHFGHLHFFPSVHPSELNESWRHGGHWLSKK